MPELRLLRNKSLKRAYFLTIRKIGKSAKVMFKKTLDIYSYRE
jgi:hypothetical protein